MSNEAVGIWLLWYFFMSGVIFAITQWERHSQVGVALLSASLAFICGVCLALVPLGFLALVIETISYINK